MFFIIPAPTLAVVPILIGPLQVLLAVLPAILVAIGGALIALFKPSTIKLGLKIVWRNKLATLLVAAVATGLSYGIPKLTRHFSRGNVTAFTGKAEWSMFRGGLSRRGGGEDGAPDPAAGGRIWAFAPRFKTYYSSPTVIGNRVLASAADKGVFADRGAVYCLDAATGAIVWEFSDSDFRATFSSPSVAGNYVVCGEGLHLTRDARILCLDFANGRKRWEVRTSSHVESSPCLLDGVAFCGAGADGIYALKLDTPSGGNPVAWHIEGRPDARYHTDASPAAVGGRVYFSSAEVHDKDWNGIACVEAATGKEVWHVDAPFPVWGPPTIVGDRLFIGMGNGNFVESAEQVWSRKQDEMKKKGATPAEIQAAAPRFAPGGELWCLDVKTAKPLWRYKLKQTLLGAVAEADGKLYFAARDGVFTCLTLDGDLVARWEAREGIVTSPAVGRDHVYVVTDSGRLYGIDRQSFRPVWEARPGSGDAFMSSPAVGCGHIYVGTPQDGLVCLGTAAGKTPPLVWAGSLGGPGKSGWLDGSALPPRGAFAWRWPADDAVEATNAPLSALASPAVADGTLYLPVRDAARTGLVALQISASSNAPAGAAPGAPVERWFAATTGAPAGSAAVTDGRVYFAENAPDKDARRLSCLDAASGSQLWQVNGAGRASGAFTLTDNALFACIDENAISCFGTLGKDAGRLRWKQSVNAPVGAPAPAGDLVLAATGTPPSLTAFDAVSGKVRWSVQLPARPVAGPVAGVDMLAVPLSNGVVTLSLVNGGTLWTLPCEPAGAALVADDRRLAIVNNDGSVIVADWHGVKKLKLSKSDGLPPMLCGDRLLYTCKGALMSVVLPSGQKTSWLDTSWLGAFSTPPVLANGNLYFATADKGLVCARQVKR